MKNEIKHARSGNGRLVVGGLHADVLVVFRQTWFFSPGAVVLVVVVEKRHDDDDFQTTRKVRYFTAVFLKRVLKFYVRDMIIDFYDDDSSSSSFK